MGTSLEITRGGLFAMCVGLAALTAGSSAVLVRYTLADPGKAFVGAILVAGLGLVLLMLSVFGFVRESRSA